ncbi:hypothetical protein G7Y89_g51 [Cudoniella acicularis]|uniref:EF-hand domain-containing protein n=1 Tax=Cudoniella acicularis TaxID=354080 RepID=A0A8H4RYW9_9HELO|nr:hypothetical protein G7Y89_g51 [Cudoniella acicularis]
MLSSLVEQAGSTGDGGAAESEDHQQFTMPFFLFGPLDDSWNDSWAIGNDVFTTYRQMPPHLAKAFDEGILKGINIAWGSIGPDGLCFFSLANNRIYRTSNANLLADVSCKGVDHLTFSPGGGWFIRYTDGTIRLSMTGTFPSSFHKHFKGSIITQGCSSIQNSNVTNVWFGAGDTILIQYENGALMWEGLPDELSARIRERYAEGYRISKGTCLSPMSKYYYFLEWEPKWGGIERRWSYKTPQSGILKVLFVREVLEGNVPVSHTLNPDEGNASVITPQYEALCREAFTEFATSEGKPYMTNKDFKEFMGKLIEAIPGAAEKNIELQQIWDVSDLNHDGKVTLDEFTLAFTIIMKFGIFGASTPKSIPAHIIEQVRHLQGPIPGIKRTFSIGLDKDETDSLSEDLDELDLTSKTDNDSFKKPTTAQPTTFNTSSESRNPPGTNNSSPKENKGDNPSGRGADEKQLRESLQSSIVKENPNVQWEDVAGLDAAKEELQEAVVLPLKFPQMFSGKRKPRRGILLYGPPGTGKSYLAKAVATEVESTLFSISSSDVMSKWIGESERLVKTLFEMAREHKPSIIFIDELDALCGNRDSTGADEQTARMKTELMVQIDGVGNDNTGILLLAATNLPWTLDPAMRRRFQRKIHIPLPDEAARIRMFEIHVGDIPCGLEPKDYEELGRRTKGLSGSDISIAVQDALMQPVKKISGSKFWRKVDVKGKQKWTPCKEDAEGAIAMNWRKVPASRLLEPTLEVEDFFSVLSKVKPSVAEAEIAKCVEWTKEFGLEGA